MRTDADVPPLPKEEWLYTPRQIAAGYQVSTKTISRWIAAGLPALNVGSAQRPDWRIRWLDVRRWLEDRRPGAAEGD